MSYNLVWTGNNLQISFEGDVTYDELVRSTNEHVGDSRFDLMKYSLYNFLKVSNFIITEAQMIMLSAFDKGSSTWNEELKLACIVKNKNTKLWVDKYVELMKDLNWEIRIFESKDEGLEWCEK